MLPDPIDEFVKIVTTKELGGGVYVLEDCAKAIAARLKELETALTEIAKAEGEYSMDPLTHATNCIESMQAIAIKALGDKA